MKIYVTVEGYMEGDYFDGYITGVTTKKPKKQYYEFELEIEDK